MYVQQLWRYPVKSMRGERLDTAEVRRDGIRGDRIIHVQNARGLITARTHPALLALTATLRDDGEVLVDGRPWWHPEVERAVRDAAGDDAHLVPYEGVERFDILPLLVATDGAIEAFGRDERRLRPNIVLGGVAGLTERDWETKVLTSGRLVVRLDSLRGRCIVTTYDPDTLNQDVDVLRDIGRRFAGKLALNAAVLEPGTVRVGDAARVIEAPEQITDHPATGASQ